MVEAGAKLETDRHSHRDMKRQRIRHLRVVSLKKQEKIGKEERETQI